MQQRLSDRWVEFCQEQPETGMGYQSAILNMQDGGQVDAMIYNCSILDTVSPVIMDNIVSIEILERRDVDFFGRTQP